MKKYISPEITLLELEVGQVLCVSQGSLNLNVGIGPWEEENEDYNILQVL